MKWIKLSCKLFIFGVISAFIILIGLYVYAYFAPALDIKNANQFLIYDDKEELIYQGSSSNSWVNIEDISQDVIDAVISVEDKNFYSHHGFDYLRIVKALYLNFKNNGIVQGASTISQQYVKNLYLEFDKTWERKIEEALLTMKLEMHYEKDEILEGYLNSINFGQGNYGIENASYYYFNKSPKDLSLEEAIMLVGIPKNPNNYNPVVNYDKAVERAKVVAQTMVNNKIISQEVCDSLYKEKLEIYGKREQNNLQTLMYYQDAVNRELKSLTEIPKSLIDAGGLKIYTSLNVQAQTYLEQAIIKNMDEEDNLQVASILVNPHNGEVMALVGGYDYAVSQYNRAIQSKRQVGSTIKPILYYAALENGMVSSSTFLSEPTTFVFASNQTYSPANFNNKYGNKDITMAAAISYSDNIYAVKTHLFLGEDVLVDTAKRMGISANLPKVPSLALGTSEISMLDYATGYTTLASGGYKRNLGFIRKVEDMHGNVLYERENEDKLVLNYNYVYILNELMTSTYNSAFDDYNSPTVISIAGQISRKYAVKTGSSGTDFWMVGYNPDILMMVWNGYDDAKELKVSQGAISKKIWVETVENVLKDKEAHWYEQPENVVGIPLDAVTGKPTSDASKSVIYYYVKGSEGTYSKESYVSKEKTTPKS